MKLIYQSPKTKHRSSPIDEGDKRSRAILEEKGWRIVERIVEDGEDALTYAGHQIIHAAAEQVDEDLMREVVESEDDALHVTIETDEDLQVFGDAEVVYIEPPVNLAASLDISEAQEAALLEAGFDSLDLLRDADDDDLLEVPGIGRAAIEKIRAALVD